MIKLQFKKYVGIEYFIMGFYYNIILISIFNNK